MSVRGCMAMIASACLAGCAGTPPRASPAVMGAAETTTETWEYAGHAGKLVRTASYRLFTTAADLELVHQMPGFLEAALERYTTAFGPLARPTLRLDTFLMGDRGQWSSLTRQVMGPEAATYLKIERGGFASGGRALLWTIGRRDTLAIAAHEGWHQFTQRTFRQELPAWLEEGIAVYMEGFVDDPSDPGRPIFLGWANVERFEQLKAGLEWHRLIPLERLLTASPQELIAGSTEGTLTYYAQLWALMHFLRDGEGGRYRRGLFGAVADAQAGKLRPDAFKAYFGLEAAELAPAYRAFVERIVAEARPELLARGVSPLSGP